MIIANPIYDVVFKRMLENERVAKFFIGTLLDQTIQAVEVKAAKSLKIFFYFKSFVQFSALPYLIFLIGYKSIINKI